MPQAETLETATFWHRLPQTYTAVRDALAGSLAGLGTPPIVMCHVSHVYPAGASLYFTVGLHERDPLAAALSGLPRVPFAGRLYAVHWADGAAEAERAARGLPYLEAGAL